MAVHPTGRTREIGAGYIVASVFIVALCFWAALGFPGYEGFSPLRPPPQTSVAYVGNSSGLERLATDMLQGYAGDDPVLRQRARQILHSLTMTEEEMAAVVGSETAKAIYPEYAHGMAQFMRDSPTRWHNLVIEAHGEFSVSADIVVNTQRIITIPPGDMALYDRSPFAVYRLSMTLGAGEKALTVQLHNLVYVNGNWRMLGPWVSEYLARQITKPS